jgi:nicotinamide mononucleotide transporter
MVARRLIENWLYWVVIDSLAAYLYFSQQLLVTAILFVLYVGIVIHGFVRWYRQRELQVAVAAS